MLLRKSFLNPRHYNALLTVGLRIARVYNACPDPFSKEEIETWARKEHPQAWKELEVFERIEKEERGAHFVGLRDDVIA